jgi:hypothetical protein
MKPAPPLASSKNVLYDVGSWVPERVSNSDIVERSVGAFLWKLEGIESSRVIVIALRYHVAVGATKS